MRDRGESGMLRRHLAGGRYLLSGCGRTFFSSISLLVTLFFSAVTSLWCARDTGRVAMLLVSTLSTSTVATPPTMVSELSVSS